MYLIQDDWSVMMVDATVTITAASENIGQEEWLFWVGECYSQPWETWTNHQPPSSRGGTKSDEWSKWIYLYRERETFLLLLLSKEADDDDTTTTLEHVCDT